MGRLKIGSPNKVLAIEVLVVSDNLASWVLLNPMLGGSRVEIFVSDPVSWSSTWGWIESIESISLRNLEITIHSIGTDGWKYSLCLIQGGSHFVCNIFIQLISARPELSILGVATGIQSKVSNDLL